MGLLDSILGSALGGSEGQGGARDPKVALLIGLVTMLMSRQGGAAQGGGDGGGLLGSLGSILGGAGAGGGAASGGLGGVRFLLVDLDRIQRGIAALVFEALDVRVEGAGELAHAVLQDIREAHQQRQAQARLAQLADQLVEIDGRRVGALRTHFDIAAIVDGEITRTPVADAVYAAAVGHGPVAAIVFASPSSGHAR
ncbi:hypothetical protein T266_06910 [Pseudomonas aeruginosa VRFPA05]|nr:hypothetical protein T266_06910 [Pseudomonas aeruginosa VRFPA05]